MTRTLAWHGARDLAVDPTRSLLAVLAVAVGVFGVTTVLDAYATLQRDLGAAYRATRPAAAILWTDATDDAAVAIVRGCPGVVEAEARPVISGRVRAAGGDWAPLVLYVVRDFDAVRLDRIERVDGAWPRATDAIALERTALGLTHARLGTPLTVRLTGGRALPVRVAGVVHAGGLPPAWMEHVVTGFVPWNSPLRGGTSEAGAIRLGVAGDVREADAIARVARGAAAALRARGRTVTRVEVPPPGRHPHADQMDAFLFLLGAFAALTLALSAVLVTGLTEGWLARQSRAIGVLKALGASNARIAVLYGAEIAALAAVGTALGILLGSTAGRAYAAFSATMLNLPLAAAGAPAWARACELALGLAVPLGASALAIAAAARLTVRAALERDAGVTSLGARPLDRALARLGAWSPALTYALRAALRQPGRFVRTVLPLAVGGALFIAALSAGLAWTRALDAERAARRYDVDVILAHPTSVDLIARAVRATPQVAAWAGSPVAGAELAWPAAGPGVRVGLVGMAAGDTTLGFALVEGRALSAADSDAVVVDEALLARAPGLAVGARVPLTVPGGAWSPRVVGVVRELSPQPTAWMGASTFARVTGARADDVRALRVTVRAPARPADAGAAFEAALASNGIEVAQASPVAERIGALSDHLRILKCALLLAAVLVLLVGGLGVASALGVDVLERTREIGVLGAVGATPGAVFARFLLQGLVAALVSWVLALPLAAPCALGLEAATGQIFFHAPLAFAYSILAALAWLPLAGAITALGSLAPALRASRIPVLEALRYA